GQGGVAMIRLSDVRIGTKLAIMSGLGLLLVAGMIAGQVSGSYIVAQSDANADAQGEIGRNIMAAKASLRGVQLAGQQILVARNPADMQKAVAVTKTRLKQLSDEATLLGERMTSAEDRTRVEKLIEASEKY